MRTLLKEAFEKASKLPESVQNEIAAQLIEDIENEMKWQTEFEKSQDKLEKLGLKAVADFKAGFGKEGGFDKE